MRDGGNEVRDSITYRIKTGFEAAVFKKLQERDKKRWERDIFAG